MYDYSRIRTTSFHYNVLLLCIDILANNLYPLKNQIYNNNTTIIKRKIDSANILAFCLKIKEIKRKET